MNALERNMYPLILSVLANINLGFNNLRGTLLYVTYLYIMLESNVDRRQAMQYLQFLLWIYINEYANSKFTVVYMYITNLFYSTYSYLNYRADEISFPIDSGHRKKKKRDPLEITSLRTVWESPPSNARVERIGEKREKNKHSWNRQLRRKRTRGKEATERSRGERDVHQLGQASTSIVERQTISPSRPGHDPGDCPGRGETARRTAACSPACLLRSSWMHFHVITGSPQATVCARAQLRISPGQGRLSLVSF